MPRLLLSIFWQELDHLFNLSNIHLQVLVSLELCLHSHYILRVSNFPIVHCLKILLKLIELRSELLALIFNVSEALLSIRQVLNVELAFHFFQLDSFLIAETC
jgi:hypothetical protein